MSGRLGKFIKVSLAGLLAAGCSVNFAGPSAVDGWKTLRNQGPQLRQTAEGVEFTFEGRSNPMYYIYRDTAGGSQIAVDIDIQTTGAPTFNFKTEDFNTCSGTATVRPFFMTSDDWAEEFDRWWSNPAMLELRAGQQILTVPLQPEFWSSVYGKRGTEAARQWAVAVRSIRRAGLTFGGGCFFGHGVFVEGGTATFRLLDFHIE